jgi:hypothetical protein
MKTKLATLLLTFIAFSNAHAEKILDLDVPDTPPQMENLTENASQDEASVTSQTKPRAEQTEQTSQVGGQTEVRVTNELGTYIVKPNQSVGTSLPGDMQSSSNHAVQWVLKQWNSPRGTDPTATPPDELPANNTQSTDDAPD